MASDTKLEYRKLFYDAMKYLATLSSAGAGLVITIADRLFPKPEWPLLVVASVIAFLLALTASMMVMIYLAGDPDDADESDKRFARAAMGASIGSFVVGMYAIAVFALKNFV